MRTLIYFPVIHTPGEMGALRTSIQQATIRKLGRSGWKRTVDRIQAMWTEIERAIEALDLPAGKVRLYQDGLPVCGREEEIVAELAQAGSRNHQLLLRLKERGAVLMGTESAELLVQEYQLARQALAGPGGRTDGVVTSRSGADGEQGVRRGDEAKKQGPPSRPVVPSPTRPVAERSELGAVLLQRRDHFIADRINTTLGEGETGILFLGMLHSLQPLLDSDIQVIYPLYQPLKGGEEHEKDAR
jgi:hypothetical protein